MEIIVHVADGRARAENRMTGEETAGSAELDFNPLRRRTIDVFVDRLVTKAGATRDELAVLGEHLYVGLLTGDTRTQVDRWLTEPPDGERLQLRLKLPTDESESDWRLADLPWEYLFCPADRTFVVQKANIVLSRWAQPKGTNKVVADDAELRIGVVYANPVDDDLGRIDPGGRLELFDRLKTMRRIVVSEPEAPDWGAMVKWLQEFKPEVLHFIGHGGVDRSDDRPKIVLVKRNGDPELIPDYRLQAHFTASNSRPHVVVLDLPDRKGGDAELEPNMARLGPTFVGAGVPAVIAMQHPFPAEAALKFSETFYTALADGEAIDYAVTLGRQAYQWDFDGGTETRLIGTPVLYAHSSDVLKKALAGTDAGSEPNAAVPQPVKAQPTGQQNAQPPAPRFEESVDELVAPEVGMTNGGGQTGLLPAIRSDSRTAMAQVALPELERGTVHRWWTVLDAQAGTASGPEQVADFIRKNWVEDQEDAKLRAVAEAMEATARRAAA